MPMHDWTGVEPTIYHHFHQRWSAAIADALNAVLPSGLSALIEQSTGGVEPDVLAVERRRSRPRRPSGGTATAAPQARWTIEAQQMNALTRKANRVAIRHRLGEVVAVIEIVSPGNKAGRHSVRQFVDKTVEFLRGGGNVLLVDPFPPTPRDPQSLHKVIWDEIEDVPFEMPAEDPLLLAAYRVRDEEFHSPPIAYVNAFRVGGAMPDMPAWIDPDDFVNVPLEQTYQATWDVCPADFRFLVEHGRLPDE